MLLTIWFQVIYILYLAAFVLLKCFVDLCKRLSSTNHEITICIYLQDVKT
jgi:hypothetical protein